MASLLHCQVMPPIGGDTGWLSLQAAYDALSEGMKTLLEGLTARHDVYKSFGTIMRDAEGGVEHMLEKQREFPPVDHPVVRTHPVTGRKCLFVNRAHTMSINDIGRVESKHLPALLWEHVEHPNFQIRHRWKRHDLAMWDNRCTMHCATSNFTGHRLMHRITVLGDRPC